MDTTFPWTALAPGIEERRPLRRREVCASLQQRIRDAQMAIDQEMAPELERLQYEHEIVRRLMARAPDEDERKDWEIEADVLHDVAVMRAADLEEQQELISRYEAMMAEIAVEEAGGGGTEPSCK